MLRKIFLCFTLALLTTVTNAKSLTFKYSNVEWLAVGNPGFLKIKGTGGKLAGDLSEDKGKVSGKIEVVLDVFDTGIELRNKHMKEKYLETAKFPKAVLTVKDLPSSQGEHDLVGDLTVKGVTKPVKGKYKVDEKGVTSEFKISLKDYPVGVPSYLGVSVAEDVTVNVEAILE